MSGEQLIYGNWIRKRILWRLGAGVLISGTIACLPVHPYLRGVAVVLSVVLGVSLLFPLYAYYAFSPRGGNLQERIYDLVIDKLGDRTPKEILDIGTGNGVLAVKLAVRYPQSQVTGVDYWGDDWEYAQAVCDENARRAKVAGSVRFIRGDAAALDYQDCTFDVVVSNLTFHEVDTAPDKRSVVAEALRMLKPGGAFVFVDTFYQSKIYGPVDDFEDYVRSLVDRGAALRPIREGVPYSKLLEHPRVLGKVGLLNGTK